MKAQSIVRVVVSVNGTRRELEVPAATTLVDLLRVNLGLTGTKVGCDVGECGACTVLVDDEPMLACLMLAAEADGCTVTTIEAHDDERISRLQHAFVEDAGLQCGFCTPGMILAASRLRGQSDPDAIRAALAGNICRCTGYAKIVGAVEKAGRRAIRKEVRDGKSVERTRTVGRSVERVDGAAKAAGTAPYPQDVALPEGCLHATTVRAPIARARLRRVDATPALAVPGVARVLTAADVRGSNRFGLIEADQPVLAGEVIRGASDVVALVVAESERAAREGARRVALDLVAQTALTDAELACARGAPVVHAERTPVGDHPNIVAEHTMRHGDVERAIARAAVVVNGEYRTPHVEHAFLAPEAGLVEIDARGRLALHVATQWPEADLRQAAAALGEPLGSLRIVQRTIGGAFGGREDISLQILLLLAARATGRPVRMVWDREESVRGHGKRHPFRIRHRLAADAEGRLTAAAIDILADAGCYASTSAAVIDNAVSQACGPYAVDNVLVTGRAVYTNNPYTCAMRGFGVNQMAFAMEQQMSKLAAALGLDAATVRRRNFVADGGRLANGTRVRAASGLPKTLSTALARAKRRPLPRANGAWRYGRRLASAVKNVGYSFGFDDHATAEVTLTRDGAVVRIGAAECGQGVATVLVQIAAETLGVPVNRVCLEWQDTATAPEAGSSSASRQTLVSGNAVRGACERARRAVAKKGGGVVLPAAGITRRYTYHAPRTGPIGARGSRPHAYAYGWGSCVADVRVDTRPAASRCCAS